MPYFPEHDRGRAMDFSGSNATRKQGSYFSRKYPHKFSQLICTSCADDLQPFLNAAPKTATTSSGWMGMEGIPFLKETQTNAEFTCEFIAAINEYVCSNKAIFYG